MEFFGWLITTTLAVVALIVAKSASSRIEAAEDESKHLRIALENLGKRVAELRKAATAAPPPEKPPEPKPEPEPVAPPPPPPAPVPEPEPVIEIPPPPPVPAPEIPPITAEPPA